MIHFTAWFMPHDPEVLYRSSHKIFLVHHGTATHVLAAFPAQHERRQVSGYAAGRGAPPLSTVPKQGYLLWQKKQFPTSEAHPLAARVTSFCYSWEDLFYFRFCRDRGAKSLSSVLCLHCLSATPATGSCWQYCLTITSSVHHVIAIPSLHKKDIVCLS